MSSSFADSATSFDDAPHSFSNYDSPPPIYASGGEFIDPASETNENGPILPEMELEHEESYALREWRRQNTVRLEEKDKKEKELLSQIIVEAEDYKVEFHRKRQITSATNRVTNWQKEQILLAKLEKFHAEADRDYWKSIAELIPKEVPALEKRKGKNEQEKKALVLVVQGPKPGKPTDLSRMRHILLKLKHNTPSHLKQSPAVSVSKEPMPVA